MSLNVSGRWRPTWRRTCLLGLLLVGSCATESNPAWSRFEYSQPQMGLPFRLVLYAKDRASADRAADAAFKRVKELNDVLSDYDDSSELSRLSQSSGSGRDVPVSADLWLILEQSLRFSGLSEGAFDLTVGPLVQLWKRARRQRQLPDPASLREALERVGYRKVELDPRRRSARLRVPHMRLDAGGIAKGYAIDEALRVLKGWGVSRAIVTGGGDMAAGEPPPGQAGWRIEVAPLDVTNAPPARFVSLKNGALATSGDLFQHVEIDGRRYSHVIDPRTGMALTDHNLVTVIARHCITADALSKVVGVLGPAAGFRVLSGVGGVEAHVVRQPGEVLETTETPGFRKFEVSR